MASDRTSTTDPLDDDVGLRDTEPQRDRSWPMAGLGHEEVVPSVLNGKHQRSLLNQRLIQVGRVHPTLADRFDEDRLPEDLKGLV